MGVKSLFGSLCDYSFFERAGTPQDMRAELDRALEPLTDKEKMRLLVSYEDEEKVQNTSITKRGCPGIRSFPRKRTMGSTVKIIYTDF